MTTIHPVPKCWKWWWIIRKHHPSCWPRNPRLKSCKNCMPIHPNCITKMDIASIPPFYIMNPILILIPSWNKPKPPPRTTTSPRRQRRPVVPQPSQPQVPRVLSRPLHWNRSSGWRPFLPKRSYTPGSVAATNRVMMMMMMMMIMVASIQGMMIPKPRLPKTRVVNESATPRWKPISVVVPLQNYTGTRYVKGVRPLERTTEKQGKEPRHKSSIPPVGLVNTVAMDSYWMRPLAEQNTNDDVKDSWMKQSHCVRDFPCQTDCVPNVSGIVTSRREPTLPST